jgi:hypothetical protein
MSRYLYENRSSKYKQWNECEWNLKNTFSYDDRKGFSDLRILTIQIQDRFSEINEKYGLPFQFGFCVDFSVDNKRNRLIQRYLCPNKCFWNPQSCFLDTSHSGNLAHLMRKSLHDNFSPDFESQFDTNKPLKLDWSLSGGLKGYFPSQGLKNLIESLGITSKLLYDDQGSTVNFDNLCRKFPLAPIGVLAHRLRTLDRSFRFPAHMSAESPSNTSPNPSEVISEV